MPARPRKPATAKPAPEKTDDEKQAAVEAAVAEAVNDNAVLKVKFRKQVFEIDRDILTSARFLMAMARGRGHEVMFELLGPDGSARFINLVERGEQIMPVSAEFFKAVNAAAGWGNS